MRPHVGRLLCLSGALLLLAGPALAQPRPETVGAAALGRALAEDGHIALYAIQFEAGRADLKPDSQPQVAELVKYLHDTAGARVLVVGHTDNQGAFDANLALSQRRAQALATALLSQGIPPGQLVGIGIGMSAPLASNDTEAGRAKNRRIEVVKQ